MFKLPHIFHKWEWIQTGTYTNTIMDMAHDKARCDIKRCTVCGKWKKNDNDWYEDIWSTLDKVESQIMDDKLNNGELTIHPTRRDNVLEVYKFKECPPKGITSDE